MKTPLPLLTALSLFIHTLRAQTATQVWTIELGSDIVPSVTLDAAGNVIVTGWVVSARSDRDYRTAKYSGADGTLLWETFYNGPGDSDDLGATAALDSGGNVMVSGLSAAPDGHYTFYTAKYASADGALLWEMPYAGPDPRDQQSYSLKVDSAGNLTVSGFTSDATSGYDIYNAKYSAASGSRLWERRYNGTLTAGISDDQESDFALDNAGNVAVTGWSPGALGDLQFYTVKYAASDGATVWERRYAGPDTGDEQARALAVDGVGNVLVTGYSIGDAYTAKYAAADGAIVWENRYDGPDHSGDGGMAVMVDGAGNGIVAAYSYNAAGNADYLTVKYAAADGHILWEKRHDGPPNSDDFILGKAMDSAGNVIVTGQSSTWTGYADPYTVKYAGADGAVLWEARFSDPLGEDCTGYNVVPTPDGGALVSFFSFDGVGFKLYMVRYAPPTNVDADGDGLLDSWEQTWWGTTAGHSALDDSDRDGIPELLEEAFGLNPTQPGAVPPVVNEGGYLTITITKHPGVIYEVQTAATPDAPAFSRATTTVQVNDATTLKVRDNILIGTPDARYLRVKVTAAP